ncbi:hypothetical protein AHMF7605_21205 [Adhaeribacter arboris]|uniref:Lipocalin-like domain-containing protein n=1 Tax=Adhaeribacter arboris TaxID=2072846 RepID=A0A2T2YJZ7_9BACT|nr:hypothetical protein [Adhaeribacter arboris]PSR55837.1 hypothetical protein AHMF7605_21205 [Adhaeribacter arboris]
METPVRTWFVGLAVSISLLSGCASQKPTSASVNNSSSNSISPASTNSQPAEHADLSGSWDYVMTNEQQETITGVLTIQRGGNAGYTGHITSNEISLDSDTDITKAQLNGSNFIYEGRLKAPNGDIPFTMKGTIQGSKLEAQNTVLYQNRSMLWQVKATRK